jgi:hypothetical protein
MASKIRQAPSWLFFWLSKRRTSRHNLSNFLHLQSHSGPFPCARITTVRLPSLMFKPPPAPPPNTREKIDEAWTPVAVA